MRNNENTGLASLCAAVAILAGATAAAGIFARGDGSSVTVTSVRGETYAMATTGVYAYNALRVVSEGIGWDLFTLLLAVPAMLVAVPSVRRGSFRGRLFALGMFGYFLYQYLENSVTWAFGPLFRPFVVIYAASLGGIVWIGRSVALDGLRDRFGAGFPGRPWAVLSIGMALLLTMMWLQRIALGMSGDLAGAALNGETTMVVQAFDLGLVVPSTFLIGILAWRDTPAGRTLAAIYAVTFVAMSAAIGCMLLSAWAVEGTPEIVPIAIFGAAALAGALLGWRMYRAALPMTPETGVRSTIAGRRLSATGR